MADFIINRLRVVDGDPEALRPFIVVDTDGAELSFDRIIPMPDAIRGVYRGTMGMMGYKALFGDWETISNSDRFSCREDAVTWLGLTLPGALEQGCRERQNLLDYGVRTEKDWAEQCWGTDYDAIDSQINLSDLSYLSFETPWSVPMPVYRALATQLPDHLIHIDCQYEDGFDMGRVILSGGCAELTTTPWFGPVAPPALGAMS